MTEAAGAALRKLGLEEHQAWIGFRVNGAAAMQEFWRAKSQGTFVSRRARSEERPHALRDWEAHTDMSFRGAADQLVGRPSQRPGNAPRSRRLWQSTICGWSCAERVAMNAAVPMSKNLVSFDQTARL